MTNGRIWLLHDNSIFCTVLFYGDMNPEGKARYILDAFEKGAVHTVEDFYIFVERFYLRCYCHRAQAGKALIEFPRGICAENLDVTNNWDDYIYLINMSGKAQAVLDSAGSVEVGDRAMAVIHFQTVKEIL